MREQIKRALRGVFALSMLSGAMLEASAAVVYYDNSVTNWSTPKCHYWGGDNPTSWSGEEMTRVANETNLWRYDVGNNTGVIFHG